MLCTTLSVILNACICIGNHRLFILSICDALIITWQQFIDYRCYIQTMKAILLNNNFFILQHLA